MQCAGRLFERTRQALRDLTHFALVALDQRQLVARAGLDPRARDPSCERDLYAADLRSRESQLSKSQLVEREGAPHDAARFESPGVELGSNQLRDERCRESEGRWSRDC